MYKLVAHKVYPLILIAYIRGNKSILHLIDIIRSILIMGFPINMYLIPHIFSRRKIFELS